MKKKMRSIIVASAFVLVLGVLLIILLIEPAETTTVDDGHEHEETQSEDYNVSGTTGELLIELEDSQISSVAVTNETGRYTMRLSDDGEYSIDEYADLPINQSFVDMAWFYATSLGYSSVITLQDGSTPPLEQYGLEPPAASINIALNDGSSISYRVGRNVPDSEGLYYYTIDGYAGVFTTEITPSIFLGDSYWLSDVFYTDAESSQMYEVSSITLSGRDISSPITVVDVTGEDVSDPYHDYSFIQTAPFVWACDNYHMSLLEYELAYMVADEAMCAFPSAEEISYYGLADPRLTVSYVRDGTTHTLRCSQVFDDYFYVLFDDRDCVYRLDAASYEMLSAMDDRLLLSSDVHVRSFEALDSVTVATATESYTFTLRQEQAEGGLAAYYAYHGEKALELASYKDFLGVFNSAICVDFGALPTEQEPYVTVTLSYFDSFGRPDETVTYTSSELRRYACSINGKASGSVSSMWLEGLLSAARQLAQS